MCVILDIPCPEDPKFEAWLDRDEGTATFTYYKNQERFNFIIEDTKIRYQTDASGNEWKTFDDNILERFQDQPEVEAFYAKYPDTLAEVRDEHVSYVVGSDDGFKVRMKMYFDDNYELDYINFHCYFNKEHQTEVPETFILKYLEKFECENSSGT